jgi:hypothetical protein
MSRQAGMNLNLYCTVVQIFLSNGIPLKGNGVKKDPRQQSTLYSASPNRATEWH